MVVMVKVKESCGACGETLLGWSLDYFAIAEPFVECPRCHRLNDRSSKAMEWALMPPARKRRMVRVAMWSGLTTGVVLWVIEAVLIQQFDPSFAHNPHPLTAAATVVAALAVGQAIYIFVLRRHIRESNRRLADPLYLDKLRKLGFVR